MPMPNAAVQAKLMGLAREALEVLLGKANTNGDLLARIDIFSTREVRGPLEKMQAKVLHRLEAADAIVSVRPNNRSRGGGRGAVLWGVNNAELCREMLKDPTRLSAAIWPNQALPGDDSFTINSSELELVDVAMPEVPPTPPQSTPTDDAPAVLEVMAAVLKAVQTVGESVASLRARIDTVEQKVAETSHGVSTLAELNSALGATLDTLTQSTHQLLVSQGHVVTRLNEIPQAALASRPAEVVSALLGALSLPRLGEADARKLKEGDELLYYSGVLPEPVRVVNVRTQPGQPLTVTVERPGGAFAPVTPKSLSYRRAS